MNAFFALDELDFDSESRLMGFSFPIVFENDATEDCLNAAFPTQSLLFSVEPTFAGEPSERDTTELDFSMECDISNDAFEAGPLDVELEIVNCFHRVYPQAEDYDDFDAYDSDDTSMTSSGRSTPLSSFPSTPNNVAMNISEADIDELQLKSSYRKEMDTISPEGGLFDQHLRFHQFGNNLETSLVVPVGAY
ncbi:hypothetical protein CCMSSC00406_0004758 [Pleurotus cornucopiae]|uniref:Uncharacterized protein n=1 Tax=Pleurotus cornucopiae TaxID=5321 RepID=A0ACB7J368_PLECO|nr:hypothetical protein CCMSSC00406_0004758 [Pleurotus cornucopiae]